MAWTKGTRVAWNWGDSKAYGEIEQVYTKRITRSIKGAEVTRDADESNPAYYIVQKDGDHVLKSHSELEAH